MDGKARISKESIRQQFFWIWRQLHWQNAWHHLHLCCYHSDSIQVLYCLCVYWIDFKRSGNPHGISYAWKWFARMLNMKPREITVVMILAFLQVELRMEFIYDMWQVAGHRLLMTYGRQFVKVIAFIKEDLLKRLPNKPTAPEVERIKAFISDFEKSNTIPPPKGWTSLSWCTINVASNKLNKHIHNYLADPTVLDLLTFWIDQFILTLIPPSHSSLDITGKAKWKIQIFQIHLSDFSVLFISSESACGAPTAVVFPEILTVKPKKSSSSTFFPSSWKECANNMHWSATFLQLSTVGRK